MGFKNIALAIGLALFAVVGVTNTSKAARSKGGRPAGGGGGAKIARSSGGGGMRHARRSSGSRVKAPSRRASFRPSTTKAPLRGSSSMRLRSTSTRLRSSPTRHRSTPARLKRTARATKAGRVRTSARHRSYNRPRYHGWNRGWTRYRYWAPFWTTAFLWGRPFDPFWGSYVTWSFGVGFGNPYFYPRFGLWYHPGWRSWYYPRYGYWYYPHAWYWYYPWCGYSVYYNPKPIIRNNISYRALTIDRATEKGMFYAIYYKPATDGKKVVGKEVRLYRLTDPKPLKGKQAKLLIPQATKDRDRVVVIAKNKNDLKEKLIEDKTDGRIIIPIDNGEKKRTDASGKIYNVVKEGKITKKDEAQLKKLIDDKQKSELSALEEKIQKADVKKYKDQQKQPDTAAAVE